MMSLKLLVGVHDDREALPGAITERSNLSTLWVPRR